MSTLRIAIIGTGNMGQHHALYIHQGKIPGATLSAVCDIDPARLEWAKKNLGENVARFATADELLAAKAADAVLIATPHYDHSPLAIQAMRAGLHVISEKPAGVHTRQVREMNEEAARHPELRFGMMFNQRTLQTHQKMRELVASGELGEITRVNYIKTDWYRTQSYYNSGGWRATWEGEGGGVLVNQCPHNLDLLQWICGMPTRVRAIGAFGKYHDIEVEDDVTATLEYENGATGVFVTTTGEAPGTSRFEVIGDRGKLLLENDVLTFWRTRESVRENIRTNPKGFSIPETWKCEIPANPSGADQHLKTTTAWVNWILRGTEPIARGEEGINNVELANAMILSLWTKDWVNVPVDEQFFHDKLQEAIRNSRYKKTTVEEKEAPDMGKSFR